MKIYTKKGDSGQSSLADGKALTKDEYVFKVLGDLDELQAWLGKLRDEELSKDLESWIISVQKNLLAIGAFIATGNTTTDFPTKTTVRALEDRIDSIQSNLPPLKNFILYGGTPLVSNTQLARAVCRRLERHLVSYSKVVDVHPEALRFINRLSDALFCVSRLFSNLSNTKEIKWLP